MQGGGSQWIGRKMLDYSIDKPDAPESAARKNPCGRERDEKRCGACSAPPVFELLHRFAVDFRAIGY